MSASRRSSSNSTRAAPSSRALSGGRNGSNPRTRAPNAFARVATLEPTWPRPTIPIVLPSSSVPTNFDLSHLPSFSEAAATVTFRRRANSSANVCSTADTTFPVGEFRTRTPRRVAAAISMLSTPTPARPITASFGARERSSASTLVPLRTSRASASFRASSSFSRGQPTASTTSWPSRRSRSIPDEEIFSATTTRLTPGTRAEPGRSRRGASRGSRGRRLPCG